MMMLEMVEDERQRGRPARMWSADILMWCGRQQRWWQRTATSGENSWLASTVLLIISLKKQEHLPNFSLLIC